MTLAGLDMDIALSKYSDGISIPTHKTGNEIQTLLLCGGAGAGAYNNVA